MNAQQKHFFRLYLGADDRLAGNATRCYSIAYPASSYKNASVGGARLVKRPDFKAWVASIEAAAMAELRIDALYVKTQALRLFGRAMGDEPVETTKIEIDKDTGEERLTVHAHRSYDPATAHKALQMIGQHKDVQAFSQTVEHTHTHRLEQRLAARSKLIEGQAGSQGADLPATQHLGEPRPAIEHRAAGADGDARSVEAGRAPTDTPKARTDKVGPAPGGQIDPGRAERGTARVSAEATAK